jgi:hypothetical protein
VTTRRVDFPGRLCAVEQEAWCTWLRAHRINPMDVPVPGWLEVDDEARTIRYLSVLRNGKTTAIVRRWRFLRFVAVRQLRGPVLPFPAGACGEGSAA